MKSGFEGGHNHGHSHKPKEEIKKEEEEEPDNWHRVNLNLEEQQNRIIHAEEMKEKELLNKLKKLNMKMK